MQSNGPLHQVDDDGRKQGVKKFTEHTSEFQMVNNFWVGHVLLARTQILTY